MNTYLLYSRIKKLEGRREEKNYEEETQGQDGIFNIPTGRRNHRNGEKKRGCMVCIEHTLRLVIGDGLVVAQEILPLPLRVPGWQRPNRGWWIANSLMVGDQSWRILPVRHQRLPMRNLVHGILSLKDGEDGH